MHINGITYVNVPQKQHGYIHYNCGRWHVVKSIREKRYSLGAYDSIQEAESVLQKANEMIAKGIFKEWYKDYKITLRKRHDLHLTEVERKTRKK